MPPPDPPRIFGFVNEGPKQSLAPLPHKNLSAGLDANARVLKVRW